MKSLVKLLGVILILSGILDFHVVLANDCKPMRLKELSDFRRLSNCVAVTGNLDLIFEFEMLTSEEIADLRFPKLKEITGYLLIYQMPHLKSVGQLFPNLQLIRGMVLFSNYALILYDLPDLQEIGLTNLIKINRGGVRIEKTPMMCYGPILNWDVLAPRGRFYIDRPYRPECPTNKICRGCEVGNERIGYCWNSKNCQKYELSAKESKCPAHCFGGCKKDENGEFVCSICRDKVEKGVCVEKCSKDRYLNTETQRCVSDTECNLTGRKMHKNLCLTECPKNYSYQKVIIYKNGTEGLENQNTCEKCESKCPKTCDIKVIIRRLSQLQQYEGCTIITSSLEISISEDIPTIMEELHTYLGGIEEIHGNLKIFRSNPITSLSFLNNLVLVENNNSFNNHFAISIYENQNLQNLINWTNRTKLTIRQGGLQFHNNKMLCSKDIIEFQKHSIYNTSHDLIDSNGNIKYCINENIETKCEVFSYNTANVSFWDNATEQENFTYVIHYIQTTVNQSSTNYSFFERDSCSTYSWHSVSVTNENITQQADGYLSYQLTKLEPNTYYAFHVQIFTHNKSFVDPQTSSTHKQSPVNFFRTKIDEFSRVFNLRAASKTKDSVTLAWDVVKSEVDLLTHFRVDVIAMPDLPHIIDQRDYCQNPIDYSNQHYGYKQSSKSFKNHDECCQETCNQGNEENSGQTIQQKRSLVADPDADFNEINNQLSPGDFASEMFKSFKSQPIEYDDSEADKKRFTREAIKNYSSYGDIPVYKRTFTITNLLPFMNFAFQFFACSNSNCSSYEYIVERTKRDDTIDQVIFTQEHIEVNPDNAILRFTEPIESNGNLTVSYWIEYKNMDDNILEGLCLTKKEYATKNHEYVLKGIDPGNYSISVRAISLAGAGKPTEQYFIFVGESYYTGPSPRVIIYAILVMLLTGGMTFNLYYYRHFLKIWVSRRYRTAEDESDLVEDVEPINFDTAGALMHRRMESEFSDEEFSY